MRMHLTLALLLQQQTSWAGSLQALQGVGPRL